MACLNVSSLKKAMKNRANTDDANNVKHCAVSVSQQPVVNDTAKHLPIRYDR